MLNLRIRTVGYALDLILAASFSLTSDERERERLRLH